MVRVLSIPLFKKQQVHTIERSVSTCCVAYPNKLLVASVSTHCIEVSDVNSIGDVDDHCGDGENVVQNVTFSFPTVDSVKQIIHCIHGDYIATIESKRNSRLNRTINYVRVYANWDSVATLQQSKMTRGGVSLGHSECGMVQPMRARIAGRVTPSLVQSADVFGLEMIEIPLDRSPNLIACCQISGNLLIAAENHLMIYKCLIKSHDVSKLNFLDFESLKIHLELSFIPTEISFTENFIGAYRPDKFFLFRLFTTTGNSINLSKAKINPQYEYRDEDICIDFGKVKSDYGMTVNFPMIEKENALLHKNLPFHDAVQHVYVNVKNSISNETNAQNYTIKNLLQIEISPSVNVEGVTHNISEEFRCFAIKPLYLDEKMNELFEANVKLTNFQKPNPLFSPYFNKLKTVVLMIATSQEGYLYHFNNDDYLDTSNGDNLVSIYSFTTTIVDLVMQNTVMHALTYSGLESYTLTPPSWISTQNDPIYLIDLKSFLGVKKIFVTRENLILLANYDSSPVHSTYSGSSDSSTANWTLYNLELPDVSSFYSDLLRVAQIHQIDSVQTHLHLLLKCYILLKTKLLLCSFTIGMDGTIGVAVTERLNTVAEFLPQGFTSNVENVEQTVRDFSVCCLALGDFCIRSQDPDCYKLASEYYKVAKLSPGDILKRFISLEKTTSEPKELQGLLYCFKQTIFNANDGQIVDEIFSPIPEARQYLAKILHTFKTSTPSTSLTGSELELSSNLASHNPFVLSPFNSNNTFLTDQELSGPPSLVISDSLNNDIETDSLDQVSNSSEQSSLNQSNSKNLDESNVSSSSPEPGFCNTMVDVILELFYNYAPHEISNFVIKKHIIREYATTKIISLLQQRKNRSSIDNFALTLLYLQKNDTANADMIINDVSEETMSKVLVKNWKLLFDKAPVPLANKHPLSFSELATVLFTKMPEYISDVFLKLLISKKFFFSDLLKIFLDFLPYHIGDNSSNKHFAFQLTLEKYLNYYFSGEENVSGFVLDLAVKEALILLARFYLGILLYATSQSVFIPNSSNKAINFNRGESQDDDVSLVVYDSNYLFRCKRYKYLDSIEEHHIYIHLSGNARINYRNYVNNALVKLEALICSDVMPSASIQKMHHFIANHSNILGATRLLTILKPIIDSVHLLIETHPKIILHFAKERFTSDSEWTYLITVLEQKIDYDQKHEDKNNIKTLASVRREVLIYLATTTALVRFLKMLPITNKHRSLYGLTSIEQNILDEKIEPCQSPDDDIHGKKIPQVPEENVSNGHDLTPKLDQKSLPGENDINLSSSYISTWNYEQYVQICKQSVHAQQINQFIIVTGQQLLTTLNL